GRSLALPLGSKTSTFANETCFFPRHHHTCNWIHTSAIQALLALPLSPQSTNLSSMSDLVTVKRALISVSDKTGLADFAKALHDEFKIERSSHTRHDNIFVAPVSTA